MCKDLIMISSNGWVTSIANTNIINDLFPPESTVKQLKYVGLTVDRDCYVSVNGREPFFIDHRLGVNYDTHFEPIDSLMFTTDGISYYFLAGY